jgi:hypothetical protein
MLHHRIYGNSLELPFFLFFPPQNQAQNRRVACGFRDRENEASPEIGKSSNFFGFRGGLDPLGF